MQCIAIHLKHWCQQTTVAIHLKHWCQQTAVACSHLLLMCRLRSSCMEHFAQVRAAQLLSYCVSSLDDCDLPAPGAETTSAIVMACLSMRSWSFISMRPMFMWLGIAAWEAVASRASPASLPGPLWINTFCPACGHRSTYSQCSTLCHMYNHTNR